MTEGTADFLIIVGFVISFLLISSFVVVAVVVKDLRANRTSVSELCNTEAPSP